MTAKNEEFALQLLAPQAMVTVGIETDDPDLLEPHPVAKRHIAKKPIIRFIC